MNRIRWLVLAVGLGLGLLLAVLVAPGVGLAQPARGAASPAAAQGPVLGLFLNIHVDTIHDFRPAVAYDDEHDTYLVVWDQELGGGTWAVYGRLVGSDGLFESDVFTVAHSPGTQKWQADVVYNPDSDDYLVAYAYDSITYNTYDIWGVRVSWDASWVSGESVIYAQTGDQVGPALAYSSGAHELLVVYQNNWADGLRDVAAQRIRASDYLPQSWANVASGPSATQRTDPDVAYNAARDEYLIVYRYQPDVSSTGDVLGKVALSNLAGVSAGSEISVCTDSYDQISPAVAAGPDEYLVVWSDGAYPSEDYDIYGRRVSGAGVPQAGSGGFPIAGISSANQHETPAVAYGYGYLVAWVYDIDDSGVWDRDVSGRYVTPGQDAAAGGEFAIDDTAYDQYLPAVACAPSGCLVVEEDEWAAGGPGDLEIRGRMVSPHRVHLPLVLRDW